MTITFLTFKAKGPNHPTMSRSLWKEATQNKCDILCVQETHFHNQTMAKCSNPAFPRMFVANADTKKRGVLTAIRVSVVFTMHQELVDPFGHYHILICDINSATYTVANVYAPSKHQFRFLRCIFKKINQIQRGYLLICGDLNLPPDPKMDSTTVSNRPQPSLQPLL